MLTCDKPLRPTELIDTLWNVNVYTPNDLPVAI